MIFLVQIFLLFSTNSTASFDAQNVIEWYAPEADLERVAANITFWEDKIAQGDQSTFQLQLAGAHFEKFQLTGVIHSLKQAEQIYTAQLDGAVVANRAAVQRALAQVFISQHRFCEALELVKAAARLGRDLRASELMLFDLYMELNMENAAYSILDKLKSNKEFHVLIRMAKWEDSQGRLTQAIDLMESAKVKAEQSKQMGLMSWIYTNLADFYGHDGQIERSAGYFKKALELRPSDWYAAKGLAWILYAGENKPAEGLTILNKISMYNETPGLITQSAEMFLTKGNIEQARELEALFLTRVLTPEYGSMYARPAAILLAEQGELQEAQKIAEAEVSARPDPSSYAILAYVHLLAGDKESAKRISREEVIGKTFEPEPLFYQLMIFQDDQQIYKTLYESVKEARFELGPVLFNQLNQPNNS